MTPSEIFQTSLYQELSVKHGEMIGGAKLAHVLGYSTASAFCKALERETLNLAIFHVEGRSGRFALTADVALWLINNRAQAQRHPPKPMPVQLQAKKGELK